MVGTIVMISRGKSRMQEKVKNYPMRCGTRVPSFYWCLFGLFFILPACTYTPYLTHTKKSGVEQLLVARALDNALKNATLAVRGTKVVVDVASLMWDEDYYVEKALTHWFLKNGAQITDVRKEADWVASVLVKCAGTDDGQFYLGVPAMTVPLTPYSTPQINLLSGYIQKGRVELEIILYRKETVKEKTPLLVGQSYFKKYTILFIPVTKEDIY